MKNIYYKRAMIFLILISFLIATIGLVSANELNYDNSTDVIEEMQEEVVVDEDITLEIENDNEENSEEFENQIESSEDILSISNSDDEIISATKLSVPDYTKEFTLGSSKVYLDITARLSYVSTAKYITYNIDGVKYTTYANNPKQQVSLNPTAGKISCSAEYNGEKTYFTITKIGVPTLSVPYVYAKVNEIATISPTVYKSNSIRGTVEITINNKKYTINGGSSLNLKFDKSGVYTGTATYTIPGDYYKSVSKTFKVIISEEPLIIAQNYYKFPVGKTSKLNIYVVNSNGDPINSGTIYLNQASSTVNDGYATFSITPKEIGVKYYNVKYSPSSSYYTSVSIDNAFPIIAQSPTKLTLQTANANAGGKFNIKYTLKDYQGYSISNKGKFIVNGKTYSSLSNIKSPKNPGTYYYKVTFKSTSDYYQDSSATVKVICKHTTKMTAKNIKGYENKKVKVKIIVKDGNGKKVKKGKITLKLKGKTYKAKVKNGKAKKTIRIPKPGSRSIFYYYKHGKVTKKYVDETYKCRVKFIGNSKYQGSSYAFKVISKKKPKTNKYTPRHNTGSSDSGSSKHKSTSKKTTHKTKTNKKKSKSYGYYPTSHKKIPKLNTNLFKKEPTVNPYTNLNNIKITTY